MPDDAALQMALAQDPGFLNRVQYVAVKYALAVFTENPPVEARVGFARTVLGNPAQVAPSLAVAIVNSSNLMVGVTTIHPNKEVTTDQTDGSLFAVVNALWDTFAGTP